MKTTNKGDINTALMDALDIEWRAKDVAGVTIRLRAGKLPTVTVHRVLQGNPKAPELTQRFELRPII